jgi:hypothetical protein
MFMYFNQYCDALPGNGSVNTFKHSTINEAVFSMRIAPRNNMGAVFLCVVRPERIQENNGTEIEFS